MIEVGIGKCTGSPTAETIMPIEDTRLMVATFNYNHCQLTLFFGLVDDVDEVIYGYVLLDVIITANCVFMCVHCHPRPSHFSPSPTHPYPSCTDPKLVLTSKTAKRHNGNVVNHQLCRYQLFGQVIITNYVCTYYSTKQMWPILTRKLSLCN